MYKPIIYVILALICIIIFIQSIKIYNAFNVIDNCKNTNFNLVSPNNNKKLLLLGDSTVCGTALNNCNDSIAHKFYNYGYNVTKIGEVGFTINDLFKELLKNKHLLKKKYDLTVIFIGTNDILQHPYINTNKITKNLNALLYLITQYNCDGNLGQIIIPSKGNNTNMGLLIPPFTTLLQNRINAYDQIKQNVCSKFNVHFVPLSDKLYKCGNKCRNSDNMHLNGTGFDIVVNDIMTFIEKHNK
jgi:lysophospholipase L1-like esterase